MKPGWCCTCPRPFCGAPCWVRIRLPTPATAQRENNRGQNHQERLNLRLVGRGGHGGSCDCGNSSWWGGSGVPSIAVPWQRSAAAWSCRGEAWELRWFALKFNRQGSGRAKMLFFLSLLTSCLLRGQNSIESTFEDGLVYGNVVSGYNQLCLEVSQNYGTGLKLPHNIRTWPLAL